MVIDRDSFRGKVWRVNNDTVKNKKKQFIILQPCPAFQLIRNIFIEDKMRYDNIRLVNTVDLGLT